MSKFRELKEKVLKANLQLVEKELVVLTWGNVSEYDRENGVIAIKPSGVSYDNMKADDIVVIDINGNIIEGDLNPSSDTPTHLEIYRNFENVNAVVHTHSKWATIWAQSGRDIPAYGTTHADYFYGSIPCTGKMSKEMIKNEYELNTGKQIIDTFRERNLNPDEIQAVICYSHGPFSWGKDCLKAVENSFVMEYVANMARENEYLMEADRRNVEPMEKILLDKHFLRKHGKDAYYGQKVGK